MLHTYFADRWGKREGDDVAQRIVSSTCLLDRPSLDYPGQTIGCYAAWTVEDVPEGDDPATHMDQWRIDHLLAHHPEKAAEVEAVVAEREERRARIAAAIEAAPDRDAVTVPVELVERTAAANAEARDLLDRALALRKRYGTLHDDLWQIVEDACPLGVPDDFWLPIFERVGYWSVVDLLTLTAQAMHDLGAASGLRPELVERYDALT